MIDPGWSATGTELPTALPENAQGGRLPTVSAYVPRTVAIE